MRIKSTIICKKRVEGKVLFREKREREREESRDIPHYNLLYKAYVGISFLVQVVVVESVLEVQCV